jgi:hypothetical protein
MTETKEYIKKIIEKKSKATIIAFVLANFESLLKLATQKISFEEEKELERNFLQFFNLN